jgi:hypothetical protein
MFPRTEVRGFHGSVGLRLNVWGRGYAPSRRGGAPPPHNRSSSRSCGAPPPHAQFLAQGGECFQGRMTVRPGCSWMKVSVM